MFCSLVNFCNPLEGLGVCMCGDPSKICLFFSLVFSVGVCKLMCFNFPDNGVTSGYHSTQGGSLGVQMMQIR